MDTEARNAEWFAEYEKCEKHLRSVLRRWCLGNGYAFQDYEDAIQFACLNTLEHWDRFDGKNFAGWAFTVATNHIRWGRREESVDTQAAECVPLAVPERGRQKQIKQVRLKEGAKRPSAPRSKIIFDLLAALDKKWYKTRRLGTIVKAMAESHGLTTHHSIEWRYYTNFLEMA